MGKSLEAVVMIASLSNAVFRISYPVAGSRRVVLLDGFGLRSQGVRAQDVAPMTGEAFAALFHPDDRAWLATELPRELAEQGEARFTRRVLAADGSERWIRGWERVIERDDAGMVTECMTTDITAETLTQQAVKAQAAQLDEASRTVEALVGNLPGNVFRLHYSADNSKRMLLADGGVVRATPGMREWFESMSPDELRATFAPEDQPLLFEEVPRRLRETGFSVHTFRHAPPNGPMRWLRAWETVVSRDGDEMVTEGIVLDVTEEVNATQARDTLIGNLPCNVFRLHYDADNRKRVLLADGSVARAVPGGSEALLSLSPEQFAELFYRDDWPLLFEEVPRRLRETGVSVHTFRGVRDGNPTRWFRAWEKVVSRDGDEMVTEGVTLDVTDEVEAGRRLETLVANLPGNVFRMHYRADGRKRLLFIDGAVVRSTPGNREWLLGLDYDGLYQLYAPEDRDMLFVEVPQRLRDTGFSIHTFRHWEKDGQLRWMRALEKVVSRDGDEMVTEGMVLDVTEEMTASLTLETLVANLPGNVFRLHYDADNQKRLLFVDGGMARSISGAREWMLSVSPEDYYDSFPAEERELLFEEVPRRLRETGASVHTFRHFFPDGSFRWMRAYEKVSSRHGAEMVTEGMVLDVTEEVTTSQKLEALVANLPGMVFRFRYPAEGLKQLIFADGSEVRLRKPAVDFTKLPPEALAAVSPPEQRQFLYHELPRLLRENGRAEFLSEYIGLDGKPGWMRNWEQVISRDGDDMITEGISINVTEEVLAKQAHEDSERLYRDLVSMTAVGVAGLDATGRCTYVNERFLAMTGLTSAEFLSGDWFDAVHADDRERAVEEWQAALRAGAAYRGEFRIVCRRDGSTLWVLGQATPRVDAGGVVVGWVAAVTDITDRHRREEMERQLNQAHKMEALGQLAGSVAHDFNNLLGAVLGFARFIVEDTAPEAPARRHAQRIIAAGERGKALIEQILSFARREDFANERYCIADLVSETRALLQASIPRSVRMTISVAKGGTVVSGDRHRLGHALINLCVNARDALGGAPGDVRLAVQPTDRNTPALRRLAGRAPGAAADLVEVWSDDDGAHAALGGFDPQRAYISVRVSDTGCGMDATVLDQIFKPFFTTKERGHGTGLGLSMVSGVVLAHGGAVVVHSRPGEGTCFELVLPVAEGAANRPDSDIVPARPGRLLLVDDDPDFGEMLLNALERSGFSVTFCLDPRDALARVRREPAAFDALVTDQIMPHLSGTEIIRHVRSVRGDLPCIICTGYAEELLNHRELAEVGVYALLRKPMNVREMVTTVTHALTRGSAGDRTRLN